MTDWLMGDSLNFSELLHTLNSLTTLPLSFTHTYEQLFFSLVLYHTNTLSHFMYVCVCVCERERVFVCLCARKCYIISLCLITLCVMKPFSALWLCAKVRREREREGGSTSYVFKGTLCTWEYDRHPPRTISGWPARTCKSFGGKNFIDHNFGDFFFNIFENWIKMI